MEAPPPNLEDSARQGMLPEILLSRTSTLRMADRQLQKLLYTIMQHRQRQVVFMQCQAAGAAQAGRDLPPQAAQLLQRGGFERHWGQLDAAWRQARAAEREAWTQMRAQQRLELMQIWQEQAAAYEQHMLDQQLRWQHRRLQLRHVWEAATQAALQQAGGIPGGSPPAVAAAAEAAGAVAQAPPPAAETEQAHRPAESFAQSLLQQPDEEIDQMAMPSAAAPVKVPAAGQREAWQGQGVESVPQHQAEQAQPEPEVLLAMPAPSTAPAAAQTALRAPLAGPPHVQRAAAAPMARPQWQRAAGHKRKQPEAAVTREASGELSSGAQPALAAVLGRLTAAGGATTPAAPGAEDSNWLLPLASLDPPPPTSREAADAALLAALLTAGSLPQAQQPWGAAAFHPVPAPLLPLAQHACAAGAPAQGAAAQAAAAAMWQPMRFD